MLKQPLKMKQKLLQTLKQLYYSNGIKLNEWLRTAEYNKLIRVDPPNHQWIVPTSHTLHYGDVYESTMMGLELQLYIGSIKPLLVQSHKRLCFILHDTYFQSTVFCTPPRESLGHMSWIGLEPMTFVIC